MRETDDERSARQSGRFRHRRSVLHGIEDGQPLLVRLELFSRYEEPPAHADDFRFVESARLAPYHDVVWPDLDVIGQWLGIGRRSEVLYAI